MDLNDQIKKHQEELLSMLKKSKEEIEQFENSEVYKDYIIKEYLKNHTIGKNSLSSEGVKSENFQETKEKTKKGMFKSCIAIIMSLAIFVGSIPVINIIKDFIKREKELADANDFMSKQIVVYLNEAEIKHVKTKDGILLLSEEIPKLLLLFDVMKDENFDNSEVMYTIYENFGHEVADEVAKQGGYTSFNHYLRMSGYVNEYKSSDYNVFENHIQEEYVRDVNNIKQTIENTESKEVGVKK